MNETSPTGGQIGTQERFVAEEKYFFCVVLSLRCYLRWRRYRESVGHGDVVRVSTEVQDRLPVEISVSGAQENGTVFVPGEADVTFANDITVR
jgi:hypothetical protein